MGHDDTVKNRFVRGGQVYRKPVLAGAVDEETVGVGPDPPLGSPNLVRRLLDGSPKPSAPILRQIAAIREGAILVRKYDDVILEHDEQVADLFAVAFRRASLFAVHVGVAPQRQKGPVAQFLQVALGRRDAIRTRDSRTRFT